MVRVLSLSDMTLATHALTAAKHFIAFGVCQEFGKAVKAPSNPISKL